MIDVTLSRLLLTVELENHVADPYAFFGLRTVYMAAFREVVGCRRPTCTVCLERGQCPYDRVFGQRLASDPVAVKRFQKPSLPFVFEFPTLPPVPNRGVSVIVGLTLVGESIDHLRHHIDAFERALHPEAGGPVAGSIRSVFILDAAGIGMPFVESARDGHPGGPILLSLQDMIKSEALPAREMTVSVITPLRIVREGTVLKSVDFPAIARTLLRRLSSLAYYYGEFDEGYDFRWLSERCESIRCTERKWEWKSFGMGRGGVTGAMTCSGDLVDFHPFLLAGKYFHLGKGSSFGLGALRFE